MPSRADSSGTHAADRVVRMRVVLNGVVGDLLPSAFAVALSPIPVVAVVVVLGGRVRARRSRRSPRAGSPVC